MRSDAILNWQVFLKLGVMNIYTHATYSITHCKESDQVKPKTPATLPIIHKRSTVARSRLFQIEALDLEFSNGATRTYERLRGGSRGAVMVVPITEDGQFILVREYAAGTESYELGFPKGVIDAGESPEQAGNRELKEEIGFGAEKLSFLKKLSLAPAYMSASMVILKGEGLYPEKLEGDEPEPMELVYWPIARWQELLASETFSESRSVTALMLAVHQMQGEADA